MKFNLEMKFKKGDLVEVIEQDYFRGINYPKGTCWVVDHHICKDTVRVVDESQPDGTALLGTDYLRKVEEEKEMTFKKGDVVKVIKEDEYEDIKYPLGSLWVVAEESQDGCTVRVLNHNQGEGYGILYGSRVAKVSKVNLTEKEEQPSPIYTEEEVNRLISQAYQQFDNDSQRLAYLQGYFVK